MQILNAFIQSPQTETASPSEGMSKGTDGLYYPYNYTGYLIISNSNLVAKTRFYINGRNASSFIPADYRESGYSLIYFTTVSTVWWNRESFYNATIGVSASHAICYTFTSYGDAIGALLTGNVSKAVSTYQGGFDQTMAKAYGETLYTDAVWSYGFTTDGTSYTLISTNLGDTCKTNMRWEAPAKFGGGYSTWKVAVLLANSV